MAEDLWLRDLYARLPLSDQRLETRFLRIYKGSGDAPIRCTLFTSTMFDIEYEALSYTWGHDEHTKSIQVNRGTVGVTQNLFSALLALRQSTSSRVLWVDALCINQPDLDERAVQVHQMGQIYHCAHQVLVWLGEEADGSSKALETIRTMSSLEMSLLEGKTMFERGRLLDPVKHLLCRRYWTRAWIVQEIAQASPDPLVICGSQCVQLRQIIQFVNDLPHYAFFRWDPWPIKTIQAIRDRARTPARLRLLDDMSRVLHAHSLLDLRTAEEDDLFYLLTETRDFHATDPRDKIFAFLGMARGFFAHMMVADYSVSIHDISVSLARAAITRSGSLDITSLKKPPTLDDLVVANRALPSWAPDFSSVKAPVLPAAANFGFTHSGHSHQASFASQSNGIKTLLVKGVLLGTIETISLMSDQQRMRYNPSGEQYRAWVSPRTWGRDCPDWDEIIFLIHVRLHQKNRWMCHFEEVCYVDITHRVVWMKWADFFDNKPDSETTAKNFAMDRASSCWSTEQCLMNLRMVHTDTQYVAFVENSAPVKVGDVVVLLQNTMTLKVLRRMPAGGADDEEQFEVASDIYVHQPDQHEYERNNHSWRSFVLV